MAKKSRSTSKRQTRATTSRSSQVAVSAASSSRSLDRDFNPDYTPVIQDLKRIGTLAGMFFIVLVALSFILK